MWSSKSVSDSRADRIGACGTVVKKSQKCWSLARVPSRAAKCWPRAGRHEALPDASGNAAWVKGGVRRGRAQSARVGWPRVAERLTRTDCDVCIVADAGCLYAFCEGPLRHIFFSDLGVSFTLLCRAVARRRLLSSSLAFPPATSHCYTNQRSQWIPVRLAEGRVDPPSGTTKTTTTPKREPLSTPRGRGPRPSIRSKHQPQPQPQPQLTRTRLLARLARPRPATSGVAPSSSKRKRKRRRRPNKILTVAALQPQHLGTRKRPRPQRHHRRAGALLPPTLPRARATIAVTRRTKKPLRNVTCLLLPPPLLPRLAPAPLTDPSMLVAAALALATRLAQQALLG